MGVQTTKTANIYFPDGAKVSVQPGQTGAFIDVGAISGSVTAGLNWDENELESANAGKLEKQIKNMTMAGDFTLWNLDPEGIVAMGAGIFEQVDVAGSAETDIADQEIATAWTDKASIPFVVIGDGAGNTGTVYRLDAEPTLASVTGSVDGALTENDDYTIIPDSNSPSGFSISLNVAGTNLTTTAQTVTIVYTTVTPVASTVVYAGTTTSVLTAYAMRIEHTDDSGLIRSLDLYAVDSNSGGFAFSFKGAEEDGVDEMPISFTAKLDTSKTDGRQLMAWTVPA